MLLNILRFTEQSPTTKNDLVQNINNAKAEKSGSRKYISNLVRVGRGSCPEVWSRGGDLEICLLLKNF